MKLGQLKAFHAIHTLGSTVAATRQLGLSQSSISSLLSQFEKELGFPLYEREKGRLQMRPEAEEIFQQVQLVLQEVDTLTRLADSLKQQQDGVLRVAVPGSLTERALISVLKQLQQEAPKAKLSVYVKPYENIQEMVAERKIDVGVVKLPLIQRELQAIPLCSAQTVVILPKNHALAQLEVVTPRDLQGQRLIVLGGAVTFWQDIANLLKTREIEVEMSLVVHDTRAACALVEAGLGISLGNALMVSQYERMDICWRPFKPAVMHEFCLIHHPALARTRLFERFHRLLEQEIQASFQPTPSD
ncbi:LysR substrate-binding domain-containing protein [Balneatrix alpica]|uniref:LysR substrate-binding domain-containing protein n=1 Tax=Balneatrix alpica TaxID=75684 RepID=A0ABV5ZD53_9GAMM|nr:LysR substrate-binding domain-containing protein [Balneatrix alpica]